MADIALDIQGPPSTPSTGVLVVYADSGSKQVTAKNDAGRVFTIPGIKNWSTADQDAASADTYLTGSSLAIPQHLMQTGTVFRWRIFMSKTTASGTGTPSWMVRVGTAGTTADTARLTFTGPAQTGVTDEGSVEITAVLRNTGAAGILQGGLVLTHQNGTTGISTTVCPTLVNTSGGFDTTVANLIVGVSVNPGSTCTFKHRIVVAEASNL